MTEGVTLDQSVVQRWHELVQSRNPEGLDSILADDVVFHSPIIHTPQVGKAITTHYLTAAFHVLLNDSFTYVREVVGDRVAVLEFKVEIDGIVVNGVDILKWDSNERLIEFKVMLRPIKAVNLVHQKMAATLQAN